MHSLKFVYMYLRLLNWKLLQLYMYADLIGLKFVHTGHIVFL